MSLDLSDGGFERGQPLLILGSYRFNSCLEHIDFPLFRVAAESGMCHVLAGVTCGPFHAEVVARIRELMKNDLVARLIQEAPDATSRD